MVVLNNNPNFKTMNYKKIDVKTVNKYKNIN